ncbi:hypothetical protein [Enhygromyxa salina]|uniref:Uncharacterized protein n=1 Tax=Enhygromyxa salina TaxID=215803 RepID=A0A2S9Y0K0_9BACT|nr:hypothetical protein [Enhygromyxa salina]PRP98531.1 hypothetical protein ENSA7_64740 [Enhygromyxa salina]
MTRRKGSLTAPPSEWCRLLADAHHELDRVRMLWRRGNVPYRPLVPDNVKLDDLHNDHDWDGLELAETHFVWDLEDAEFPAKRAKQIEEIVVNLWTVAANWTRQRGDWCDFQLVGIGHNGEQLFEDGRRCRQSDDEDDGDSTTPPSEGPRAWTRESRESAGGLDLQREHARALKEIIDYTKSDRDNAVERSNETLENNHRLWAQANNAVREAIEYQREQVERARDEQSGRIELKARALEGMERTKRSAQMFGFLKYGLDCVVANVIPFADRVVEVLGNRNLTVFPEFKCAQQAMAYLVHTLTVTQLDLLMKGDRKAGGAVLAVLDQAARVKNEHEALVQMSRLVPIFRSDLFQDVANPEQQLAARYIIGRLAMYAMGDYGEDTESTDTTTTA